MTNTYDALIIGAGQAGPPLAERLTAAGMSVGLVERRLFGGTCVNTAVSPPKRSSLAPMPRSWRAAQWNMASAPGVRSRLT
jgi:pyruvate/2-oxoglutarate dehydrogenase complex dihydrolipoamide dehydrogenase (E3) component